MSKQVAKKSKEKVEETLPAVQSSQVDLNAWGVPAMNINARDIQIPKILAMQPGSNAVTAGEAKFGEFRDSLSGNLVGDVKNPIDFIPFFMEKVFVVMRLDKGQYKFNRQVPIVPAIEDHDFEHKEGEWQEKWYRTLNFYVLLPQEVADGSAIPYILSFRSSSARAGQKLATTMYMKNLKAGKTPPAMTMSLSGATQKNDKGTFVVMDVKEKRASTSEEIASAFEWVKTVLSGRVKVDHSDLESEASSTASAPAGESTDY